MRREVLIPLELARRTMPAPLTRRPGAPARIVTLAGDTMGTSWRVTVAAVPPLDRDALQAAIEEELEGVIAQMSPWRADSVVSRFNRAPAGSRMTLPNDLYFVLDVARQVAEASDGACDATRGELVDLWGFGPPIDWRDPGFTPPAPGAIQAALARSGWQRLELDARDGSALQPGGLRLDLSAIAKGHAVDRLARRLTAEGIDSHLVDIGGELRGTGIKPDGQPWWVALEQPPARDAGEAHEAHQAYETRETRDEAAPGQGLAETVVALCGISVATSGDYRRWYEHAGQRLAHTIDPRTGRPVVNDLAAVTVLDNDCIRADAWSTALMVLGVDAGLALAETRGLAARFIRRTATGPLEARSPAWRAMLE